MTLLRGYGAVLRWAHLSFGLIALRQCRDAIFRH